MCRVEKVNVHRRLLDTPDIEKKLKEKLRFTNSLCFDKKHFCTLKIIFRPKIPFPQPQINM